MRKRKAQRTPPLQAAERPSKPSAAAADQGKQGTGVDLVRLETAFRSVLEAIGEDPKRPGLRDTPRRMAELYQRIFSGLNKDPSRELRPLRVHGQDGPVLVTDITFHSMCEHHLLPFFGRIHIAYLPRTGHVTGLSSLTKVTEVLSRRPQLQERLTKEIADTLMKSLRPLGLLVVIEAQHMCMAMNESGRPGTTAVSVAARGLMLEQGRRRETLLLMNLRGTTLPRSGRGKSVGRTRTGARKSR